MARYTRQQWFTVIVFSFANFCNGASYSLQAPFYPRLAEEKGASPTQYGFVFGVYELIAFIMSPIYGKYLNLIGAKFLYNAGIFTTASTLILFGFLNHIDDTSTFIGLSFAVRIVEALGSSGLNTAAYSIAAMEFRENLGATFASLETFLALGMIVGPTMGGALFTLGGYTLPFVVVGVMLLTAATMTFCILPNYGPEDMVENQTRRSMSSLLKIPAVALAAYTVFATCCGTGFIQATLEPHLRPFELPTLYLSLMFVLNGGVYGICAPFLGKLCDKIDNPYYILNIGGLLAVVTFLILGPAPFLPVPNTLSVCIVALIFHGLSVSAELIASFTSAFRAAVSNGFPDDIGTCGLVSAMWTSSSYLGCFIGPSAGGVLFDWVGFRWGAVWVMGLHLLVVVLYSVFLCCSNADNRHLRLCHDSLTHTDTERTPLLTSNRNSLPQTHSNPDSAYFSTT